MALSGPVGATIYVLVLPATLWCFVVAVGIARRIRAARPSCQGPPTPLGE